jgi:hypothetical protein
MFLCIVSYSKKKEFTITKYEGSSAKMDSSLYDFVYNVISGISFINNTNFIYGTQHKVGEKFILADATSKTKKDT